MKTDLVKTNYSVLIIDDEEELRLALKELLEIHG